MSRYRVLAWLICLPLLPVVYAVGLAVLVRDLWRHHRQKLPTHPTRRKA